MAQTPSTPTATAQYSSVHRTRSRRCPACGRDFVYEIDPRGGRPPEYCDGVCRQWEQATVKLHEVRDEMQDRFTPGLWMTTRSEWWNWLNTRPWNRGVKAGSAEEAYCLRRRLKEKLQRKRRAAGRS